MAARHSSPAKLPVGEELVITRVLDAPREAVWNAWTDPTSFMRWWGPKGFTSPACKIDLRVGGKYLACMRSPEGQDYWSTGVYREIVPKERIVYTDNFADAKGDVVPASHYGMQGDWPLDMQVTVTLEEEDGKTIMTLQHGGIPSATLSDCETGWRESFDKLDRIVASTATDLATGADSRSYRLARSGASLTLVRGNSAVLKPGPRQVLVRVGAASLNYRDLLILGDVNSNREGLIPLSDGAGTVVAVGAEVSRWTEGDRVSPNFIPGWRSGDFSAVYFANALGGGQSDGVLTDYIVADEASVVGVAPHLTLSEAATLPCAGVTAWHALFERGALQAGETVLVQGTGGVALFGLQLASAHGARVIVTSSSDDKLERARALGAWRTINYRAHPDWEKVALEFTDGRGVDHILELGGPETYDRSIAAVAAGGSIAQIGVLTGFASKPDILPLQLKNASIHGICVGSVEHFERLNRFVATHRIRPVIDRHFAFDEAPAAYEHLKAARHFGKVVIDLV